MPEAPYYIPVPQDPDPPGSICFQVNVPADPGHVRAFLGVLTELATWSNWERDPGHKATIAARRWKQIIRTLRPGCDFPGSAGANGEDDYMLRQSPDNPCLLETSVDGVTWCAWADLSKCLAANPAQPPPGGPGPGPGQTQKHCLKLSANGQVILPIPVNDNYVITITDAQGGWNDGSSSWYCPDGSGYSLGVCFAFCGHSGGDPSATACHMSIIAKINGVYYPTNVPIVVPSGTGSVDVVFQANDGTLSDNFGDIEFCVTVENPAVERPTLTYSAGSGPSQPAYDTPFLLTPTGNGCGNYEVAVTFSIPVKFYVLGESGYHDAVSPNTFLTWDNPPGTRIGQLDNPPDDNVLRYPNGTTLRLWHLGTDCGGAPYSITAKILPA